MTQVSTTGRRASVSHRGLIVPVESAKGPDANRPRYHAFDALRGMAMFLVIGLHAALAYVEHDIKGVLWCVRDAPTASGLRLVLLVVDGGLEPACISRSPASSR